ncbi:MAG: family 1 glycosylhydrolase, partial [Acidobacteriales bacterium]|nr:family 1 glycosylhydrolase [Terriglobales bacterium]
VVFQPANPAPARGRWITGLLGSLCNESCLRLMEHGRLPFPLSLAVGRTRNAKGAFDFVGLNVYSRFNVAFDLRFPSQLFGRIYVPDDVPQGDRGFENAYGEAYPQGLRVAVERVTAMGKSIYILENGVPDATDRIRPWLIVSAAGELHRLIEEGRDIRGYFHWTLTDNFEWSEGWRLRFGLVSLDPSTQQRTMRKSAYLYSTIARSNELTAEVIDQYGHSPSNIQSKNEIA